MHSEGYSTWFVHVSVCLSVCLSVDAYSGTTGYEAAYELYKRVQIYKGLHFSAFIITVCIVGLCESLPDM